MAWFVHIEPYLPFTFSKASNSLHMGHNELNIGSLSCMNPIWEATIGTYMI